MPAAAFTAQGKKDLPQASTYLLDGKDTTEIIKGALHSQNRSGRSELGFLLLGSHLHPPAHLTQPVLKSHQAKSWLLFAYNLEV